MSTTGITVALQAADQTAAVIQSAKGRFLAMSQSVDTALVRATRSSDRFGASMSRWQRLGANAFLLRSIASAALSVANTLRNAAGTVKGFFAEFHQLTDRADESGSSASGLLALSHAFEELGLKGASVESVSTMLARMRKATGDVGVDGFRRQMAAIARIGDETARATELQRVFGREGVRMAGLASDGADKFLRRLDAVTAALPKLSEEAIRTGSDIDKAFDWAARDVELGWKQTMMDMVQALTGKFTRPAELELKLFYLKIKYQFKMKLAVFANALLAVAGVVRRVFIGLADTVLLVLNAVYDAAKNVWNYATGDLENVNWVHTRRAFDDAVRDAAPHYLDYRNLWDSSKTQLRWIAADWKREEQAVIEEFNSRGEKIAEDVGDPLEKGAAALDAAAWKISDALNPAKWTDAASYAARALSFRSVRDGGVGLRPGATGVSSRHGFASGASGAGATSGSASGVRPIAHQLLEALRGIGADVARIAASPTLQMEAV